MQNWSNMATAILSEKYTGIGKVAQANSDGKMEALRPFLWVEKMVSSKDPW